MDGIKVVRLPSRILFLTQAAHIENLYSKTKEVLVKYLKKEDFDIVVCHGIFYGFALHAGVYHKKIGKKFFVFNHLGTHLPIWMLKLYNFAAYGEDWLELLNSTTVFTNSMINHELLVDLGIKKKNLMIIHLGVSLDIFKPLKNREKIREEHGYSKKDIVLLWVGRDSSRKRLNLFINTVKKLGNEYKAIIVSNTSRKLGKKFKVLTDANLEELVKCYNIADLFAFTSTSESYGLVSDEAMACGTPSICTNIRPMNERIIAGKTGFLFDKSSDLLKQIRKITKKKLVSMREDCVKYARKHLSREKALQKMSNIMFKK
jgi:glycosyltransferase involved in cell wall biosynthesis